MNVVIKKCAFPRASTCRRFVRDKVAKSFSRFSGYLYTVSVYLSDENGPKGGKDKTCKMIISTIHGERIVIKDTQARWQEAVTNAVKRARRMLVRTMGRSSSDNHRVNTDTEYGVLQY